MKPQDILFLLALIILVLFKRGKYLLHASIISCIFAGILFIIQNLFTSQRFTWYGLGFFVGELVRQSISLIKKNKIA
jgi:hypothetical protein